MKLLVLNYEFPPVGGGGGQASAALCKSLAERGHQVRVLTARLPGLAAREMRDGYEIVRVQSWRRSPYRASLPAMFGYLLGAFLPGLRQLRSWKPDLMHVHFAVPTGALALALGRLTGVRYVLTAHLGDVPGGVPEKTRRWFRLIYPFTFPIWRAAAHVVAVSGYTRTLATQHYRVPIDVIPNGIPEELLQPEPKAPADVYELVFVGRFQPQKDLLLLVDVLGAVKDLPWRATLVGDGPLRTEVESRIRQLGLQERIRLTGWVSPEEATEHLRRADLLFMPSRSEGLPVVGVQALALGLALLICRAGGLAELVEDRVNGRICPVGDSACLEAGLRWCLTDRERLLGLKAASLLRADGYRIDQVAQRYEHLFIGLVEGHGAPAGQFS